MGAKNAEVLEGVAVGGAVNGAAVGAAIGGAVSAGSNTGRAVEPTVAVGVGAIVGGAGGRTRRVKVIDTTATTTIIRAVRCSKYRLLSFASLFLSVRVDVVRADS